MKRLLLMTLFFLSFFVAANLSAKEAGSLDYRYFSKVPVLDEGRVKPLDSFARSYLRFVYGRDSVGDLSPSQWLAELLFDHQSAYERPFFYVPNKQVLLSIGITPRKGNRYSFKELSLSMGQNVELVNKLLATSERTLAQDSLIDLYEKTLIYFDISRSFSLILPSFFIQDEKLANNLDMPSGIPFTYLEVIKKKEEIITLFEKRGENASHDLVVLRNMLHVFEEDKRSSRFKVIPSSWQQQGNIWLSPWEVFEKGHGSPVSAKYLGLWKDLSVAYLEGNQDEWGKFTSKILAMSRDIAGSNFDQSRNNLEVLYNEIKLFEVSDVLYFAALALFVVSLFKWNGLSKVAFLSLIIGSLVHLSGIVIRVYLTDRPPVATLYESIVFVSFVAVLFSIILERRSHSGTGLLIGSILGLSLQFIAMGYAADGDTMGTLAAVLNTNFWLSTHVITITIGYGCCLVAGTLAHIYLLQSVFGSESEIKQESFIRTILGIGLIALFFSLFGTILGGIWADQSWGRFWGWDPKENGAMLIVLWLVFLLHSRLAELIGSFGFAAGMVITNIIVALAWFGVNLLNIGLHSYGFTEDIATNLALFCGFELLFIVVMYGFRLKKGA